MLSRLPERKEKIFYSVYNKAMIERLNNEPNSIQEQTDSYWYGVLPEYMDNVHSAIIAGCGHGVEVYGLAKMFSEIRFIGVDVYQPTIRYAKKHFRLENIKFVYSDISDHIKTSKEIDMMILRRMAHHMAESELLNLFHKSKEIGVKKIYYADFDGIDNHLDPWLVDWYNTRTALGDNYIDYFRKGTMKLTLYDGKITFGQMDALGFDSQLAAHQGSVIIDMLNESGYSIIFKNYLKSPLSNLRSIIEIVASTED
ncbi:MAG: class I SAM-dependent methyltransferase [archaeon]